MNFNILGNTFISAHSLGLIDIIYRHLKSDNKNRLVFTHYNLHGFALQRDHSEFYQAQQDADYGIIDSTIVCWALQFLGYDIDQKWRATMLDWIPLLLTEANKNNSNVFLLGTKADLITSSENILASQFPNISFASHHGYISDESSTSTLQQCLKQIEKHNTDILLVGMGMPMQEIFLTQNKPNLRAPILISVGGYFDYICGATYTPPRWSGKFGLEWLFRLLANPKRLWKRYLIEPWPVLLSLVAEILKRRLFRH